MGLMNFLRVNEASGEPYLLDLDKVTRIRTESQSRPDGTSMDYAIVGSVCGSIFSLDRASYDRIVSLIERQTNPDRN